MAYSVKEIFKTLQGEGAHTGRAAVFCRFAGCNLWSGREQDRASAQCRFCDTDFVGVDGMHALGFEIGVETNGTQPAPEGLDWICVSPKAGTDLVLTSGNELKLVYPQDNALPSQYENLAFDHFYLQPMDCDESAAHTEKAINYCMNNPRWRLSLQTHKTVGIR